ncbi:MAG TPA: ShlB/FhaC/HecB family hemolysin secretion/activation protein [Stenomitos sp.]
MNNYKFVYCSISLLVSSLCPFVHLNPLLAQNIDDNFIKQPFREDLSNSSVKNDENDDRFQNEVEFVLPSTILIREIKFIGNTVVDAVELNSVVQKYIGTQLHSEDLPLISQDITNLYISKGYLNSGAFISPEDNPNLDPRNAQLTIRVAEGTLENVKLIGPERLKKYVLSRLKASHGDVFNSNRLEKSLLILQNDINIKSISSELQQGSAINSSVLTVNYSASQPFSLNLELNNHRSAGVGTFERGINLKVLNPFQFGDEIGVSYKNTQGSHLLDLSYDIPINSYNSKFSFNYIYGNNQTIQKPFDKLNIFGIYQSYVLSFEHPLFHNITEKSESEFILGLSMSHFENQDSLVGFNFPLLRGADSQGRLRTTVLSFYQNWKQIDENQSLYLSSKFNFGLDIGTATDPKFANGKFFSWKGDVSWSKTLPWNMLFRFSNTIQLSDRPLVASEQFGLGGYYSVRGYPQDFMLFDNGFNSSIGIQIPIFEKSYGKLSVSPFFDIGLGWNNPASKNSTNLLSSVGLGLDYDFNDKLLINLTYAYPLINRTDIRSSLQDNGVSLSLIWKIL